MDTSETQKLYGTFRCPVCGHRDGAEVEVRGDGIGVVRCSYCETTLEVQANKAASGRFDARVAHETIG